MALFSLLAELFSWGAKSSKPCVSLQASTPRSLSSSTLRNSRIESHLPPWYTAVERSYFTPVCHPRVDEVVRDVDCYFLQHWPFPDNRTRRKFVDAEFTRNMCYNYPEALDDRIGLACRLITLLFLVDGERTLPVLSCHTTTLVRAAGPPVLALKLCGRPHLSIGGFLLLLFSAGNADREQTFSIICPWTRGVCTTHACWR